MSRLNLTLAIEEGLLREARTVAAQRQTSINEMICQYLEQVVSEEHHRRVAWEGVRHLLDQPSVVVGGQLPNRDELHRNRWRESNEL
jgi:hypothetical protein